MADLSNLSVMRILLASVLAVTLAAGAWSTDLGSRLLMLSYIDWIEARSSLTHDGQPLPDLVQWDERKIHVWMYGQDVVDEVEANESMQLPVVMGLYDPRTRRIIVPARFDPWSFDYAPTMVHELVHYLQDINGTLAECAGMSEREAYELSNEWIAQHNHPREPMDGFTIAMIELSCAERPHAP